MKPLYKIIIGVAAIGATSTLDIVGVKSFRDQEERYMQNYGSINRLKEIPSLIEAEEAKKRASSYNSDAVRKADDSLATLRAHQATLSNIPDVRKYIENEISPYIWFGVGGLVGITGALGILSGIRDYRRLSTAPLDPWDQSRWQFGEPE